jgi:alpha-tubulin suppressor-like RCC1 family protein
VEPSVAQATVVGGSAHSCGLSRTGVVSCWGLNTFGQLGRGSTPGAGASPVTGPLRFKALSANGFATCGITVADKVYCWGQYRPNGQIMNQPTAVLPELSFQSLSVGSRNVCALTAGGEAWCWGENTSYQLGLGPSSTQQSEGPGQVVGGLRFTAVSAGYFHTCAIDQAGRAWCWGANDSGQLGVSSDPRCGVGARCSSIPLQVEGGLTFSSIAVGPTATCAVTTDARLFCWGAQLPGFYSPVNGGTPTAVPGAAGIALRQVSYAINAICALSTAGAVMCMGGNESGQLGRGGWDASLHHDLVPVSGGRGYASLATGVRHACATQADGAAYCWGSNAQQQLGSTPTETCQNAACSSVPARVTLWTND